MDQKCALFKAMSQEARPSFSPHKSDQEETETNCNCRLSFYLDRLQKEAPLEQLSRPSVPFCTTTPCCKASCHSNSHFSTHRFPSKKQVLTWQIYFWNYYVMLLKLFSKTSTIKGHSMNNVGNYKPQVVHPAHSQLSAHISVPVSNMHSSQHIQCGEF